MKPENEMLVMVFIAVLIVVLASALGGCTARPVVTAPCPKPNIPAPPVDYMAQLKPGTPAPEFVRACLMTRVSAISAYQQCAHVCGGYE